MLNSDKNYFIQAVRFIHKRIDEPLTIEIIAQHVSTSVSSLKRIFLAATGSSIGCFIRRLRMEQAFRSLQNKEISVLEIALQSGFEDHSAFARAFKENFGYSPSSARDKINIVHELESAVLAEPEIIELESFALQIVTQQGTYFEAAPRAWNLLRECLTQQELNDDFSGTFVGIGHDNPHEGEVAEDRVRFSAGIAYAQPLGLKEITVAGGHYARFKYTGKLHNLGLAYHYIYGAWHAISGIKIAEDKPAFIVFDIFPEGLEEYTVALYVPVAMENR